MSGKRTEKRSREAESARRGRVDLARLRTMTEREIQRTSPPELADLPADFWDDAEIVAPPSEQAISLRVDRDVLAWFKEQGPRYQTKMNAVLRMYVSRAKGLEKSAGRPSTRRSA